MFQLEMELTMEIFATVRNSQRAHEVVVRTGAAAEVHNTIRAGLPVELVAQL